MTSEVEAGLVTRPDALVIEISIGETDANPNKALLTAQADAADLMKRVQHATAGAATLTLCGTKVTPIYGHGKVTGPTERFAVSVEGRIEVAFAAELDYWKRSALVVALAELADGFEKARKAQAGERGVSLGQSRVIVKDPEAFRPKLTAQWVQRARAFATAAQTQEAPLYLLDCATPGEIAQKERSFEEVALSLTVSCRLGSPKAPFGAPPPPR